MLSTPSLVIHREIFERFRALNQNGRLAHAYLFVGPHGIGKSETALAVARLVNCLKDGALDCPCPSCTKIQNGNHPDVCVLAKREDGREILIEQVREELLPRFTLKPLEGRYRVFVVRDAELMNPQAANAFLKTLEEPASSSLIILTTALPGKLLPTILSRCHAVRFAPLANSALALHLKSEYDVAAVEAEMLARFSAGSAGRAVLLGADFIRRKNAYLEEFLFRSASEAVLKKFSSNKDTARELCEVLLTFFRDVSAVQAGVGDGASEGLFFHGDRLEDVRKFAARYSAAQVQEIITQTVKVMEAVKESFNVKVALTLLKEMI